VDAKHETSFANGGYRRVNENHSSHTSCLLWIF
jgi:hypothetical protein